jgi:phosphoribosylamine--glycine ligase
VRVLVVGSGAREHALAWTFASEPDTDVVCAPGNPGIAAVARLAPVAATDIESLIALARRERTDLTVVGPEAPLAAGVADRFAAAGLPVFGPTRAAAQLETSKAFAKAFMQRHRIPTAAFRVCASPDEARSAVADFGLPVVLKADGLAAGKGVVVAEDAATAEDAIDAALVRGELGAAGDRLVVEEFLRGQEASLFVLCDGARGVAIGTAQDHKRVFDDDRGPNTGGMGAFAPSVLIDEATSARVEAEIVAPVLAGMMAEGMPFSGFLYVGLMLTADGPKVVEFNVRFGDPEAQVVLPSLAEPLAPLLADAAAGRAPSRALSRSADRFVGVVLASGGYPGAFRKGLPIQGLDDVGRMDDVLVFHAGTTRRDGVLVTDGGRVLTVVGRGADFETAMARAYEAARRVEFEGRHFRTDIGRKATAR